jgi:hypothetical protein
LVSRNLRLTGYAVVGRNSDHLQLTIEDEYGNTQRSIWWQGAGYSLPDSLFDLAYTVRASTYRGQRDIQVEWVDYKLIETPADSLASIKTTIEVIDMRSESEPLEKLAQIQTKESILLWGEADPFLRDDCLDRLSLYPSKVMAIWTIPPGYTELQAAVLSVMPEKVYLFGNNPGMDKPEPFLRRLLGLLKYCIKSAGGTTSITSLAAATAQKTSTIRIGLGWLEARGYIHLVSISDEEIQVQVGNKTKKTGIITSSTQLNSALSESGAFRRYFLSTDKDRLIVFG